MNRRIRIILLTVSLLLVVGTLGWLTHVLLIQAEETGRSERRIKVESLAHEAKLEMDRLLTAFITFEQARLTFECKKLYADLIKPGNFIDKSITDRWYGESHGGFHKMYVVEIVNVLSR